MTNPKDQSDSEPRCRYQMKLAVDTRISQKTDNGGRELVAVEGLRIDIVSSLSINAQGTGELNVL